VFGTLQDRLPKELRLAGITTMAAANRFIRETYLAAHNARFTEAPADPASALVPVAEAQWRDVLAVQEVSTVAADNTVAWKGQRLQIPPHPARPSSSKPRCASMNIPQASSPSFMGRVAWCAGTQTRSPNQINPFRSAVPRLRQCRRLAKPRTALQELSTVSTAAKKSIKRSIHAT
jgi:hypothetical protein